MKKFSFFFVILVFSLPTGTEAAYRFSNYEGKPPIHVYRTTGSRPQGMTPSQIKAIYHLPTTGGAGTIAIIGAYNDTSIEKDLTNFDKEFGLPACTKANGCLVQHLMSASEKSNAGWATETSLDVEWTHAIAPNAKILLVEATTQSGANLLKAVDYATKQKEVVAISMSWGGPEFPDETTLDSHFVKSGVSFFASSGDNGTGASWPASSPNVIAVGGTTIILDSKGNFSNETAWSGSGGGVSAYEKANAAQTGYNILKTNGMRAIPDVAYDADPRSGFPIVHGGIWETVGGTSAGAPQWAAIEALGGTVTAASIYADKAGSLNGQYFRDIVSGTNGNCGYVCTARKHYDFVTGLGSPLTDKF